MKLSFQVLALGMVLCLGAGLIFAASHLGGVYEVPGAHRQSAIIDTSDAKLYVVYVIMADLTT